jgi:branched-chain amino acid transport system ATP-binding protein
LEKREVLLKLNNIETYYQDVIEAIRGVSLEVKENSIVCVLGANGAGKTTLLRTIARLLDDDQPEKGTIVFSGQRIERKKSQELVRLGIALVPEGRELFPDLTVSEHLKLGAYTRRDSRGVKEDWQKVITYFPILEQRAGQRADTLSGGEQQMLAIGRALMTRPKLLLLDEPSLGLAPIIMEEIFGIIKTIHAAGSAILLVEQNAHMALEVADYGYVLENGRIVFSGSSHDLAENEDVKEFYLGVKVKASIKGYRRYKKKKKWR